MGANGRKTGCGEDSCWSASHPQSAADEETADPAMSVTYEERLNDRVEQL